MKRIALSLIAFLLIPFTALWSQTVGDTLALLPDYTVFSRLVEAVGLTDTLTRVEDETYRQLVWSGQLQPLPQHPTEYNSMTELPECRRYGFTLFAEPDALWQQQLGKAVADITVADVEQWLSAQGTGLTLRDFVRYHILPVRLAPNKLVIHYNEKGYDYRYGGQFTIPIYEIYEPLGGGQLLKLYQCGPAFSMDGSDAVYINRNPQLNNGMHGNLAEVSVTPVTQGIRVDTEKAVSLLNGMVYPITQPLLYTQEVREQVFGTRMRYDVAGLFPELMNNDIRDNRSKYMVMGLPISQDYRYCEGLDIQPGSYCYYFNGWNRMWYNWQGDEFNVVGNYDITLKLPPVAVSGEYELRIGVQSNSTRRGIAQCYVGADRDNLPAAGLPIDLREGGEYRNVLNGSMRSRIAWEADMGDEVYDRAIDLRLYEQGVMKAPANFEVNGRSMRNNASNLRRIVWRGYVKAGQTYYMRFRSTLNDTQNQLYLDYLEWCPRSVYDNPEEPEDIW